MLKVIRVSVYPALLLLYFGCFNDALLKQNQQQLAYQQTELDTLKHEVAALQTPQPVNSYGSIAGSCDQGIMREATQKGGERFAASDFSAALSYYKDALTACPNDAQANLNLARTYEAIGDRAQALVHYRTAAAADGANADAEAVRQAREALGRLGG
jgi:tetratricopeptide (TPR) repeat protein